MTRTSGAGWGQDQALQLHSLERLEKRLAHGFQNRSLLVQALTHRSALAPGDKGRGNEQLEFLGDAVLGLLVAEWLLSADPQRPEGELSRLRAAVVCTTSLAHMATELGLGPLLKLGTGESRGGGREKRSILADAAEAVLAALYLDGGLAVARRLVVSRLGPQLERLSAAPDLLEDAKTALQEQLQAAGHAPPMYLVTQVTGPPHRPHFQVEVQDEGRVLGRGAGASKRLAQQAAARQGLTALGCQPRGRSSTCWK